MLPGAPGMCKTCRAVATVRVSLRSDGRAVDCADADSVAGVGTSFGLSLVGVKPIARMPMRACSSSRARLLPPQPIPPTHRPSDITARPPCRVVSVESPHSSRLPLRSQRSYLKLSVSRAIVAAVNALRMACLRIRACEPSMRAQAISSPWQSTTATDIGWPSVPAASNTAAIARCASSYPRLSRWIIVRTSKHSNYKELLRDTALSALLHRQGHAHGCPCAKPAVDGHRAAVLLDDLPHAGESDAHAADAVAHVARTVIALEDVGQIGGRNADALILNLQHRAPGAGAFIAYTGKPHSDLSAVGAVFDGIGEQVVEHARQTARVPEPHHRLLLDLRPDRGAGCRLEGLHACHRERGEVGGRAGEAQLLAGLQSGEV